jgi:hypothetical protein
MITTPRHDDTIGHQGHRVLVVVASIWPHLLVSMLGAFEILLAVSAGEPLTFTVGVVGGVALLAAPWPPQLRLRLALLVIGTVPFAILTWWSVASLFLAVLALAIGFTTLRRDFREPLESSRS